MNALKGITALAIIGVIGITSTYAVEPKNEEQNSEHMFRMSRMVWGPCKDCVMKNSRDILDCKMKLDRRTPDYEACFTNVTLRNENEIDPDKCKPCICNLLKRYNVMVKDHPVINDLFCMKESNADIIDESRKWGYPTEKARSRQVSSPTDFLKEVVFNTNKPKNDLDGSLKGHVLFAQNIIIPAKSPIDAEDHRPHLVSLRDTLLLFKPLNSANPKSDVTVSIFDKSKRQVFKANMLPPDEMPKTAGQPTSDVDLHDFLERDNYDYIFSSQEQLNMIDDGPQGNHLKTLLSKKRFVKIQMAEGQWIRNVYLPTIEASNHSVLIMFDIQSQHSCTVHFQGKNIKLKYGTKLAFTFIDGIWDTIYQSAINQNIAVSKLITIRNYSWVVERQAEFINMKDDYHGKRIKELLSLGDINIKTGKWGTGKWIQYFHLPTDILENDGKFVTFTSNHDKASWIFYRNDWWKLSKGSNLIFICKNGKWFEYSDTLLGKIKYVDGYWSVKIPLEVVVPEIIISFSHSNMNGDLRNVEIGAPNELLLHTIDIGMLVSPRDEFEFQKDSKYHTEYFQQVPLSRLIVTEYEPITFEKVVLPDGTVYKNASTDKGDMYKGDMRERIGKELISIGINHANYGIHSSIGGSSATSALSCAQITAHNSRGRYKNGVQIHGLSGGGSIATLDTSRGNEFSHEIGHNYLLPHHPNGFSGSVHRSSEHFGSTWGWDSVKNVFIPNFDRDISGKFACLNGNCQEPFFGRKFGYGAMGGGSVSFPSVNKFTLHTPYELKKIQQFFESKAVFDPNSTTGYRKWSYDCKCMVEWESHPPLRVNVDKDIPRTPDNHGIAVTTLVGYYDPVAELESYVYPALHGAYGNTFTQDSEEDIGRKKCFAKISNASKKVLTYALKENRIKDGNMNKFHINVAESFKPKKISIQCNGKLLAERYISGPKKHLKYTVNGRPFENSEAAGQRATYQLETGVHYGGLNIGNCGSYNTRADLEAACTADSNCVGYSTYTQKIGGTPENGFYPWCLKRTEDSKTVDATHNYYRKIIDSDGTDNKWQSLFNVALVEGESVGHKHFTTLKECKKLCNENENCNSLSFKADEGHCYLFNKCIFSFEKQRVVKGYRTYYKDCV